MSIQTKLSVIIPVYNNEAYIERCLDSVFNQSLKDICVIVVDDGSQDKTVSKVLSYKERYSNLTVIQHPSNLGTGTARNKGLQKANSQYIAFLDSDDWLDSNAYLEMVNTLDKDNTDIALCGIRTEYNNIYLSTIRYQYPHNNIISARFALKLLSKLEMQDIFITPMIGNKVFRSSFLKRNKISFPSQSLYEDDEFTFLCFYYADKISIVSNVYQHYFQRETSCTHIFTQKHIDCLIQTFIHLREHLIHNNCFEAYSLEYYAFLDRCLFSLLNNLFSCEQSILGQRKYISYLLEQLLKYFTIQELISRIEPFRLQRLWE